MKKVLSMLLVCILTVGLLAACKPAAQTPAGTDGGIKTGGTMIVGLPNDPSSFNPNVAMDEGAAFVNFQVFNSLVFMSADQQVKPDLAESWSYNADATELTFKLREGVKWHDGEPFTSADVKWTFENIISQAGTLSSNLGTVASIEAPDDFTVVFKLSAPDSTLLANLTWFGGSILPKHIFEGTDWMANPAAQNPIGTGPFKFVSMQAGVSVELEANKDYFGEGPYLDRLVFQIIPDPDTEYQMWQNGEIDYMYNSIPGVDRAKYENNADYTVRFNLACNRNYFTFNFAKEDNPFLDVRMRQAFDLALNRQQILDTGLKGNGAVSEYYISPLYTWALNNDAKIPAQDIAKARSLIEACGYTADANGIYLQVTVDTFGFDETLVVAQANLKEAGIDLQINKLEQMAWMEKVFSGNYDVTILGGDQGPDISSIANRVGTGYMINVAFYSNPELDALLVKGTTLTSEAERAPIYKEVQKIMATDLPMVICNEVGMIYGTRSTVHGIPLVDDSVRNEVYKYSFALAWME